MTFMVDVDAQQDQFLARAGIRILEDSPSHLLLRFRDGSHERFVAIGGTFADAAAAEAEGFDGIYRHGTYYAFEVTA